MKTVAQLLKSNKRGIVSVGPDVPVLEALNVLADHGIGAVLVMEGERLVGILSERDYARKGILKGKLFVDTPVRELMTSKVVTVTPTNTIVECMALMNEKNIRHLPVIDNGRVTGVLSMRDVVKDMIAEQQLALKQLEKYFPG